jgi:hypothetical protein
MLTDEEAIALLEKCRDAVGLYRDKRDPGARTFINQNAAQLRDILYECDCFSLLGVAPPPILGGPIVRNIDPITGIFNAPYANDSVMANGLIDRIDQAVGAIRLGRRSKVLPKHVEASAGAPLINNRAFVAMPIDPEKHELDDILDAIKRGCIGFGIDARRIDEDQSNERITDRIMKSIEEAQFVIVEMTEPRPNVMFEAGYAHGLQKLPIYVARAGATIPFDLKDYPVLFYKSMRDLTDQLKARLEGLRKNG